MVSSGDLRAPQFNGENYEFRAVKMKTILIAYDLWDVVECCDTSTVSNENDSGETSGSKDKKSESTETAAETTEKGSKMPRL